MAIKKLLSSEYNEFPAASSVPSSLRDEIDAYIERNTIVTTQELKTRKVVSHYCVHCLKAHLLKKAKDKKVPATELRKLETTLPGNTGHEGYYLDSELLCKC